MEETVLLGNGTLIPLDPTQRSRLALERYPSKCYYREVRDQKEEWLHGILTL